MDRDNSPGVIGPPHPVTDTATPTNTANATSRRLIAPRMMAGDPAECAGSPGERLALRLGLGRLDLRRLDLGVRDAHPRHVRSRVAVGRAGAVHRAALLGDGDA